VIRGRRAHRRRDQDRDGPLVATCRVDRRTKDLVKRLRPGEIAIIDHEDIDRIAAEGLIDASAGAVVNASRSVSGRYPNVGPLLLAAAGIPVLDDVGPEVMDAVAEGAVVRLDGNELWAGTEVVAKGTRQDLQTLERQVESARQSMGAELERFVENTLEYMRREGHLLTDSPDLPSIRADLRGRHVLIVVRGADYKNDLAHLRPYINEVKPVLIGVDGGADALRDVGYRPDIIIGDFDSVSTATLRSGAQLIVHAYRGGKAPGAERLDELGVDYDVWEGEGTSEDIAMLLAYEEGAELIVAVGTHASMIDFLDKGRKGMASTFLVRLKVGPILVDAKGVNRLYQSRVRRRDLAFLVASAMVTMLVAVSLSPGLRLFVRSTWEVLH
jgi:uncharacterized membrane-anchored protein